MSTVLGLDVALATTGAALLDDHGQPQTWTLTTEPADGLPATCDRIARVAQWCLSWATTGTVLAVIEAPSFGSDHGQSHERAAVYWRVIAGLVRRDIPIAQCPPSTLKKWATGTGRASKHDMRRAVSKLWPGHGLDRPAVATEHGIDALALAGVGAQCWCEWPGPWLGPSPSALASITWPENP